MKIYIGLETAEPGYEENYWLFVTETTRDLSAENMAGVEEALSNDDTCARRTFAVTDSPENDYEYVDHLAEVRKNHNVIKDGIAWMANVDILCNALDTTLAELFGKEYAWAWPDEDNRSTCLIISVYED